MSRRAGILERVRRLKNGAARRVVAAFALAYLTAVVAPCATAAAPADGPPETIGAAHAHAESMHAHHGEHLDAAHDEHGTAEDQARAVPEHGDRHCPHCPAATPIQAADHSSCFALADLTNVAASHAKDAPPPLAPSLAPAAFTLPPPLASPPPPLRAAAASAVSLNVRHCVFLI